MTVLELVRPSIDTVAAHYASNKLLLIHPSSRYRTLLIAALITEPPCTLYYHGLGVEDVSLDQFLAGLVRSLVEQSPTFGRHINQARAADNSDIAVLGQALATDLNEMTSEDYLLILDEYDRADAIPEVQTFIEVLLEYLPAHCHLLINSRTLPRLPWVALVAKHQAVVLRDSRMLTSGFYSEHFRENPNVEVYALGPGYVIVNGQHVATWEGHLPRLLFFFALDRPLVTRAEICDAFWPELPLDQAVNVFHVTKRRLHKALGFDVLVHEGGHYRVNPEINLHYDVLEFVSSLVEARSASGAEAAEAWHYATEVYHGDFLQGHNEDWIVDRREDYREGYIEALTECARIRERDSKPEVALGLLLRAVNEDPRREDLHRDVIRLYGQLGRRIEAAEHYKNLEQLLKHTYGVDEPSPETRKIYREVVGG